MTVVTREDFASVTERDARNERNHLRWRSLHVGFTHAFGLLCLEVDRTSGALPCGVDLLRRARASPSPSWSASCRRRDAPSAERAPRRTRGVRVFGDCLGLELGSLRTGAKAPVDRNEQISPFCVLHFGRSGQPASIHRARWKQAAGLDMSSRLNFLRNNTRMSARIFHFPRGVNDLRRLARLPIAHALRLRFLLLTPTHEALRLALNALRPDLACEAVDR
jgi:hypothetical protein